MKWAGLGGARRLTCTGAQVRHVDVLLPHAGRLADQAGVAVASPIAAAHPVLVVAAAVDVADAPEGAEVRGQRAERRDTSASHHTSSESSSHSAPYLHVLHLVNFLPTSGAEPSSSGDT